MVNQLGSPTFLRATCSHFVRRDEARARAEHIQVTVGGEHRQSFRIGNQELKERVAQIEEMIKQMGFRWDNGFITDKDEYLQKRLGLQQELEQMKPLPMEELETAADILTNFESHWGKAEGNPTEQQRLMQLIFERIWIKNNEVVSVCLRPNYHVTFYQSGSDGRRMLAGKIPVKLLATPQSLARGYHIATR